MGSTWMLAVQSLMVSWGRMDIPTPASTIEMLAMSSMTWQHRWTPILYFFKKRRISASVASPCTTKFFWLIMAGVITPPGGAGQSAGSRASRGSRSSSVRVNSSWQLDARKPMSTCPLRSHSLTSS